LHLQGIDSVILENRTREYVEARVRAGVLEHGVVELFDRMGVADRLHREGIVHHGVELQFAGERHRLDFSELTGRHIVVYGQTEVVKDLIATRLETGRPLVFEAEGVSLHGLDTDRPRVEYDAGGEHHVLECDIVAGCDGFHGISRPSIPASILRTYGREYPYGWLGILATVAPSNQELIYAHNPRGFALLSLR